MKPIYSFIGKSVFLEKEKILVIGDLHFGYEEGIVNRGGFLQFGVYDKIKEELEKIFGFLDKQKKGVKEIVILGDLKHEFSGILKEEEREIIKFIEYLKEKCAKNCKIVLVKGNHDNYAYGVLKKMGIDIVESLIIKENLFIHGDELLSEMKKIGKNMNHVFLGHIHPCVVLEKKVRKEKYKCFLVGKFKGKKIIILPSFFPLVEGREISCIDDFDNKMDLKNFVVYAVVPDSIEVLEMGKGRALNFPV